MSQLRNRTAKGYRALRKQFSTPALVLSIAAVVLALTGGAYASSGGLSGKQKKEVETIAKKLAGKPGQNGTNGANGTSGAEGKSGPQGTPGESVTIKHEGECTKFSNASGSGKACNGTTGFTETLPSEQTETGAWSIFGSAAEGYTYAALSFPIPLSLPSSPSEPVIEEKDAHFVTKAEWEGEKQPEGCGAGTAYRPEALPGNLCIYQSFGTEPGAGSEVTITNPGSVEGGAGATGALILFNKVETTTSGRQFGTWAVTAP